MGPHYLSKLFAPKSIAVVGATDDPGATGFRVFSNLLKNGFRGKLFAVNADGEQVQGHPIHPTLEAIRHSVDLVIITTPGETVPPIIHQCGELRVNAAIILSPDFAEMGTAGRRLEDDVNETAQINGVFVVGPNCLGIMRPSIGLNASNTGSAVAPGRLALISQSGALTAAILDWAASLHLGFSAVASLGDRSNVTFGDILDYLALDSETSSILVYVEGLHDARRFMSGLRAAARIKPVIILKAGRDAVGTRAVMSHTGALIGADDVFDAALERAGAVRAHSVGQLFSAAQILSSGYRVSNNRLAVIANGGGPGVMAADAACDHGIRIAELTSTTLSELDQKLPAHWSHANPLDILADATPKRYEVTLNACLRDKNVDGVLVILVPQQQAQPRETAELVVRALRDTRKPVLTCWMGGFQVEEACDLFNAEKIPCFDTPGAAILGFSYLSAYQRNQELLLQVPGPLADPTEPDVEGARLIINSVLAEGRQILTAPESKSVLTAFRIPVVQSIEASTANKAMVAAQSVGFPVAVKINSPDLSHKSDVGGVRLNIPNGQEVRIAFNELMHEVGRQRPEARIEGVTVERMHNNPNGRELMVGVLQDPVLGPAISFGAGGTEVEVIQDRAVALPPLNEFIITRMVSRTRVSRMLGRFRNMPAVDQEALEKLLLRVSEMVCELPQIREMDINPVIVDERGAIAVDARIAVAYRPKSPDRYGHMAIHPYPAHLSSRMQLRDGTEVIIRPIRPEDAEIEHAFVRDLSETSKYFRFMQALPELTPAMLVRFTQIDYDREMALIAVIEADGAENEVGVARYNITPDGKSCEFAIVVGDEWQHRGIATQLMHSLIEAARAKGLRTIEGEVLANNTSMLALMARLGFSTRTSRDDPGLKIVSKPL